MKEAENKERTSRNDRRAQIIDSAMRVFVEKGYNGATTAGIAREAGISEVTLFRYFASKKELFAEGLEPILITGLENSILASRELPDAEKLKFILKDRIEFVSIHHEVIKLILMESQINPDVVEFDYVNKIVDLLKESIQKSGIKLKDEEVSIRLLMGSILSFLYFPESDDEKIDQYVNNLVLSIKE